MTNTPTPQEVVIDETTGALLAWALLDDGQYIEGPTCSICDGLGHGYPGAGPCPLEERGAYEPDPFDSQGAYDAPTSRDRSGYDPITGAPRMTSDEARSVADAFRAAGVWR